MMTEQGEDKKHINCSRCRMKYHNNDDSSKEHFGFTRLGERLKTCTNLGRIENRTTKITQGKIKQGAINY